MDVWAYLYGMPGPRAWPVILQRLPDSGVIYVWAEYERGPSANDAA